MADRAPLYEVIRRLTELRGTATSMDQIDAEAARLGWKPEEIKAEVGKVRPSGIVDRVASGMTFGLTDEASSLGGAVGRQLKGLAGGDTGGESFGQSYQASRDRVLAEQELGRQRQGTLGTVAELAGGLAAPIPFARAAAGLPEAIGRGAAGGAVAGALQGAGSGEGVDDRLRRAALGGALGGAVGGVVAPVADLASKAITAKLPGASRAGARGLLDRALTDDALPAADAAAAIEAANAAGRTGVTVADVAGARTRGLAEDVVQSPNPAQDALRGQLGGRQYGQGERLIGDLQALGGTQGMTFQARSKQIMERRAADAGPLFAQANSFDPSGSPEIADALSALLKTDAGPRAFQRAGVIARNEQPGYVPPKLKDLVGPDGNVTAVPPMQFLHYLKMGLDDLHGSAVSGGATGMGRTAARSIAQVRDRYRDALKAANPAYAGALDNFSSHSAMLDALNTGRETFGKSGDEMAEALDGLGGPAEQEMFRLGGLSKLVNEVERKRRGPTADVSGALRDVPDMERKLSMLLPDDAARALMAKRLDLESQMSRTANQVIGGPATARRFAQADEVEGDAMIGEQVHKATRGAPTSVAEMVYALVRPLAGPVQKYATSQRRGEVGKLVGMTDAQAAEMLRKLGGSFRLPAYPSGAVGPRVVSGIGSLIPPPAPPPWFLQPDRRR